MIIEIVDNYRDLRNSLLKLNKEKMSISALEVVADDFKGELAYNDPYKKYEDEKWCIHEEENIIWIQPYEMHCLDYLEKKGVKNG